MNIASNIKYVGVNDYDIDLFEGQYKVANGMAYNSYLIIDEKIAVIDTVEWRFKNEWLENIKKEIGNKRPTYLIISHMEPDHSSSILEFMKIYPEVKVVSNSKAFVMMNNFYNVDFTENRIIVNEGDKLSLGKCNLKFIMAPMVHWPEVMMAYEETNKVLFSADAFGKFGALDTKEDWISEARRYYFGIVGKYSVQVQNVLKKAEKIDINVICSLHGPILNDNLNYYLNAYNIWSNYDIEEDGITIAYTSMYGNTKEAIMLLKEKLIEKGIKNVAIFDLARDDIYEAVASAFKYSKLVLATTTYNANIFPYMQNFINYLLERNYQKRKIALIENGSWAPVAAKIMKEMFVNSKNIEFFDTTIKIMSKLNMENKKQLDNLVEELIK